MKRFRYLIARHEKEYSKFRALVRETFELRDRSELAWRDWQLAAKRFREYHSEVDDLVDRCLEKGIDSDQELRTFAFCFVELDPYYHRSGYTLERLLRQIKRLRLSEAEKLLIQELILKRIDTKARRNFRDICRLIPKIETDRFRNKVSLRAQSDQPSVKHRADLAVSYFPAIGKARGDGFEMS